MAKATRSPAGTSLKETRDKITSVSESNNYNNQCEINQTIPGQNNQVAGRDFIIHAPGGQDDKPAPDNPNLITCPACEKYGVFRGADLCPRCNYSFLNASLETQAEARRIRQKGLQSVMLFAAFVIIGALNISAKFKVGFLDALAGSFIIVSALYIALLFGVARVKTWIRLRKQ